MAYTITHTMTMYEFMVSVAEGTEGVEAVEAVGSGGCGTRAGVGVWNLNMILVLQK